MPTPLAIKSVVLSVAMTATLALMGCSNRPMSNPATDKIDQLFAKWNKPDSPGCSVAISRNGQLVYERGYGMANLELSVPIAPTSVFEAASISKQFTAMSIMLLVERGRLSLDDEVRKYLPEMPDYGTPLTIRHLLNHTSGLRDAFLILELSAPEDEYGDRNDVILKQLARQRSLNYKPGTESHYNNGGYVLAAIIVKRVSGQPLAAFADANIFTPLGMTSTRFQDDPSVVMPNRASNYYRDAGTWRFVPFGTQPGAVGNSGLWTTPRDLLRWASNLADPRVGSASLLADMQKPSAVTSAEGTRLGAGIRDQRTSRRDVRRSRRRRSRHRQLLRLVPAAAACDRRAVQHRRHWFEATHAADCRPLSSCTADRTDGRDALLPSSPAVTLSSEQLEGKAGLYREAGGDTFVRAFVRDGELRVALGTGTFESFRLVPVSETRFTMGESTFALEFTPPGRAKVLRSFAGEKPTGTFERVEPFSPSPAQLRAYAGVYASDELNAEWTIAEHGSTLVIRRLGNADTVVEPLATDMFTTIGDFMTFSRDARGTITGFTLTSTGARSLRFERVNR